MHILALHMVIDNFLSAELLTHELLENFISSFDFDPTGETVATIGCCTTCMISDMNTDKYKYHLKMSNTGGNSDF